MDGTGWLPCRVVPFEGAGALRVVGPSTGACVAAKWSPDGKWMYFSSNAGGSNHLWRQEFPDGKPEQLTNGVTEEEGIAVNPDGKSLITAVGMRESTVWIHNRNSDRQITSEGFSFLPTLSHDASTVYYLKQTSSSRSYVSGELWAADVASRRQERVLPGYVIAHYDISRDGRTVVFAAAEGDSTGIWIAPLDHRSAPRQLTSGGEYRAFFTPEGDIIYMSNKGPRYLYRMKSDGSDNHQVNVRSSPPLDERLSRRGVGSHDGSVRTRRGRERDRLCTTWKQARADLRYLHWRFWPGTHECPAGQLESGWEVSVRLAAVLRHRVTENAGSAVKAGFGASPVDAAARRKGTVFRFAPGGTADRRERCLSGPR